MNFRRFVCFYGEIYKQTTQIQTNRIEICQFLLEGIGRRGSEEEREWDCHRLKMDRIYTVNFHFVAGDSANGKFLIILDYTI